jgi:cytochrome c553
MKLGSAISAVKETLGEEDFEKVADFLEAQKTSS